jgi:hypothetical protein
MEEATDGLPLILAIVTSEEGARGLGGLGPLSMCWFFNTPFYRVIFLPDDLAAYRRMMKQSYALASRPYAEARAEWEELDQGRRDGPLTGILVPRGALPAWAKTIARADAMHRLAQLALAAEAYRARTGQLPERPDDLAPQYLARVPTDPFSGQPLRLKRDGKDLVMYSIGSDGIDDGGVPWNKATKRGDLVFRLRGR